MDELTQLNVKIMLIASSLCLCLLLWNGFLLILFYCNFLFRLPAPSYRYCWHKAKATFSTYLLVWVKNQFPEQHYIQPAKHSSTISPQLLIMSIKAKESVCRLVFFFVQTSTLFSFSRSVSWKFLFWFFWFISASWLAWLALICFRHTITKHHLQ